MRNRPPCAGCNRRRRPLYSAERASSPQRVCCCVVASHPATTASSGCRSLPEGGASRNSRARRIEEKADRIAIEASERMIEPFTEADAHWCRMLNARGDRVAAAQFTMRSRAPNRGSGSHRSWKHTRAGSCGPYSSRSGRREAPIVSRKNAAAINVIDRILHRRQGRRCFWDRARSTGERNRGEGL